MSPPDSEDPRSGSRVPLRLRVDYERMNQFFADYTKNLSKGGTFVRTPRPLAVGARCQFTFTLPALPDPLVLEGEVTWTVPPEVAQAGGEDAGMGVTFIFRDAAAEREFAELVQKLMEESLGADAAAALLGR